MQPFISYVRILGAEDGNSDGKKGQRFENINIQLTQNKSWIEKVFFATIELFYLIFFICHLKIRANFLLHLLTGCQAFFAFDCQGICN